MRHLELIMSDTNKMGADDVRALFSDHLEGTLEPSVHKEVDEALARDPQLALERKAFEHTVNLLRALPQSDAPEGLVGKVRDRLAQERRDSKQQEQLAQTLPMSPPRRRSFGFEIVAGFAACAAVVAIVVVGVPALKGEGGGNGGTMTAGTAAASSVSLSWRVPGLERIDVVAAAQTSGLAVQEDGSFAGDRQSAARFLVALKTQAATKGADVSGHIPEAAERVVVVVTP